MLVLEFKVYDFSCSEYSHHHEEHCESVSQQAETQDFIPENNHVLEIPYFYIFIFIFK